jgi:hypothetical protein
MSRDDPAGGFALIERIGADEYNRLVREHDRARIVATINGHEIWPVQTRFGRLYVVGGTERAFSTLAEAEACAKEITADPSADLNLRGPLE